MGMHCLKVVRNEKYKYIKKSENTLFCNQLSICRSQETLPVPYIWSFDLEVIKVSLIGA